MKGRPERIKYSPLVSTDQGFAMHIGHFLTQSRVSGLTLWSMGVLLAHSSEVHFYLCVQTFKPSALQPTLPMPVLGV